MQRFAIACSNDYQIFLIDLLHTQVKQVHCDSPEVTKVKKATKTKRFMLPIRFCLAPTPTGEERM